MQTEQQKTPKDISHVYSSENLLIPDVEGPPRLIEAQIYYKYQNTFLKKDLKRVFDNAATNGLAASGALIEVEGVLDKEPKKDFGVSKTVKLYTIGNLPNKRIVFGNKPLERGSSGKRCRKDIAI